jgi:RHS repeat-associated protein
MTDQDFYPYGGERSYSSSSGNNYKFTGKERDTESQLDDFGARFYTSNYGRFLSADESKYAHAPDPQTWNLYTYVANNPLNAVDPTGHDPDASLSYAEHRYKPMQHGESLDGSPGEGPADSNSGTGDGSSTNPGSDTKTYVISVTINGVIEPNQDIVATSADDAKAAALATYDQPGSSTEANGSPDPPPSSCSATLRFRSLGAGTPDIAKGATHSFWQIHDSSGADYTISGFPQNPDGTGWLQAFANPGLKSAHGEDNSSATIDWTSGNSPKNCAAVDAMRDTAKHFPNSGIVYNAVFGPNSNSVAHMLGNVGGFKNISQPPGSVGWDATIPPPH